MVIVEALKPSAKPLKENPFETYRDPKTGRWVVLLKTPRTPSKS